MFRIILKNNTFFKQHEKYVFQNTGNLLRFCKLQPFFFLARDFINELQRHGTNCPGTVVVSPVLYFFSTWTAGRVSPTQDAYGFSSLYPACVERSWEQKFLMQARPDLWSECRQRPKTSGTSDAFCLDVRILLPGDSPRHFSYQDSAHEISSWHCLLLRSIDHAVASTIIDHAVKFKGCFYIPPHPTPAQQHAWQPRALYQYDLRQMWREENPTPPPHTDRNAQKHEVRATAGKGSRSNYLLNGTILQVEMHYWLGDHNFYTYKFCYTKNQGLLYGCFQK